ncbi:chymotrypsin-2-like [Ischnura elegans]|uniref:chymotrypsin-2-like n=1 Tax=Ischnura elegans TaxID=197161 RepID=UPI001ED88E60|nr:chymotrypsin-2-like [Ischnura elegans]
MNTFLVAVVLIICAHVQAFDVGRLRPMGSQSQAVSAKKNIRLRALEDGYESAQPKISNGYSAKLGDIPFQVSMDSDTSEFCGGVIIHSSYVLTAAQCAVGGKLFTIYAGVVKLHGDESSRVVVQSLEAIIHDGYDPNTLSNDIALLKLSQPLHFNDYISPALLPTNDDTYVNEPAWISGWGSSYEGGSHTGVLQYAPVTVISNDECRQTYGSSVTDGTICTLGNSGVGECEGDGGGPLFTDFHRRGPNLLIGIFSFFSGHGCTVGPDGFTRVSYYRDWILSNVN